MAGSEHWPKVYMYHIRQKAALKSFLITNFSIQYNYYNLLSEEITKVRPAKKTHIASIANRCSLPNWHFARASIKCAIRVLDHDGVHGILIDLRHKNISSIPSAIINTVYKNVKSACFESCAVFCTTRLSFCTNRHAFTNILSVTHYYLFSGTIWNRDALSCNNFFLSSTDTERLTS